MAQPHTPEIIGGESPEKKRIVGLDVARLIAALGVIWLHTGYSDYNMLGHFRMPFFTGLLAYLVAAKIIRDPGYRFLQFTRSRAWRILVPFAVWLVLYRIPSVWRGHLPVAFTFSNLLMGLGTIPLWFLPFAFCASLLAFGLAKGVLSAGGSRRWQWATLLAVAGAAWSLVPLADQTVNLFTMGAPLLGAVALGVALRFLTESPRVKMFVAREWIIWILLWLLFACLSMSLDVSAANFFGVISGFFLLLAGLTLPLRKWPSFWTYLGKLSFGMYLTHWAFVVLLGHLGVVGENVVPLRFALILAGSIAAAALLQRVPWGQFLLGLEPRAKKKQAMPQPIRELSPEPVAVEVVAAPREMPAMALQR